MQKWTPFGYPNCVNSHLTYARFESKESKKNKKWKESCIWSSEVHLEAASRHLHSILDIAMEKIDYPVRKIVWKFKLISKQNLIMSIVLKISFVSCQTLQPNERHTFFYIQGKRNFKLLFRCLLFLFTHKGEKQKNGSLDLQNCSQRGVGIT